MLEKVFFFEQEHLENGQQRIQYHIRHEQWGAEFLAFVYRIHFDNIPELFEKKYGMKKIIECVWDNITMDDILDILSRSSSFYRNPRYDQISNLITSRYAVPYNQFMLPKNVSKKEQAALFNAVGNLFLEKSELQKAVDYSSKAVEIISKEKDIGLYDDELHYQYLNDLGNVYRDIPKYKEAIDCFSAAVKLFPNFPFAYFNKAVVLQESGNLQGALESINMSTELDPALSIAWNIKGDILVELNRDDEASDSYDKAIALEPNHYEAYTKKGIVLVRSDRFDYALKYLKKATSLQPNSSLAWYWLGVVQAGLEDYMNALDSFDMALMDGNITDWTEQNSIRIWYWKGVSYFSLNNYIEALKSFQRVVELLPNDINVWLYQANTLVSLHNPTEALKSFQRVVEAWTK